MMSAGTAFARAASQPIMSGFRDFCIAADTSPRPQAIKQNLLLQTLRSAKCGVKTTKTRGSRRPEVVGYSRKLPANASAGSRRSGRVASVVRHFFSRNSCRGLRGRFVRGCFVARSTGRHQKCDCQKQSSAQRKAFHHGTNLNTAMFDASRGVR